MFIAFEGLDGSGSSTQSRILTENLQKKGVTVHQTKEPTDQSPIGKMIRDVLQHKWSCSPEGLQLLFCADRAEHLCNTVEPAIQNGQVVITDRYLFSTLAYGASAVNDWEWLSTLNQHFRIPDITFLFKLNPKTCIERIRGRGSEFELFEKEEKLKKVWEGYERIVQEYDNIQMIDASQTIEEISEKIWQAVTKKLDI